MSTYTQGPGGGIQKKIRVFFTGTGALKPGFGLCYDKDYATTKTGETATDAFGKRTSAVAVPDATNNNTFAGVTTQSYIANSLGQWIEIYEPGSFCNVLAGADTVAGETLLTCAAGTSGDVGWFSRMGHMGRGTARAMQTTTNILESDLPGANATLDATGLILTDSGADFVTAEIAAGDTVNIIAGEDDGTNAAVPASYTVASVTDLNNLVLTAAAADAGTMQVSYYIVRADPQVYVELLDGDESGCQETVSIPSVGHATADTFTVMPGGKTYFCNTITIGTDNARAPLAEGTYFGQTKSFWGYSAFTTNDVEIELDTDGKQLAGDADVRAVLHAGLLDAVGEFFFLQWDGNWRCINFLGATFATS